MAGTPPRIAAAPVHAPPAPPRHAAQARMAQAGAPGDRIVRALQFDAHADSAVSAQTHYTHDDLASPRSVTS